MIDQNSKNQPPNPDKSFGLVSAEEYEKHLYLLRIMLRSLGSHQKISNFLLLALVDFIVNTIEEGHQLSAAEGIAKALVMNFKPESRFQ